MDVSIEGCSYCDYSPLISYSLCVVCETSKLCLRCSILDVPLCKSCVIKQTEIKQTNIKQIENNTKDSILCVSCEGVWGTSKCNKCSKVFCILCDKNSFKHSCLVCETKGCSGKKKRNDRLCRACYERHKKQTIFYECVYCYTKISRYSSYFNCPVKSCVRKLGCPGCYVVRPEGMYCDNHVSKTRCVLCLKRYPVYDGAVCGKIKAPEKIGKVTRFYWIESCDRCMLKIRALIESILILARRKNQKFEKNVMNVILQYALTGFY